jgi:hypothetical protein
MTDEELYILLNELYDNLENTPMCSSIITREINKLEKMEIERRNVMYRMLSLPDY